MRAQIINSPHVTPRGNIGRSAGIRAGDSDDGAPLGRFGGSGLGLAICREIMHRLGGDISYLPGQGGAAFRISLPVSTAAVA